MGELLENLFIVGVMSMVVWLIIGVIHVILHCIGVWDKMAIEIKLPKRKRYKTKVTPIYQLEESDLSGGYYIRKWELGYDDEFGLQMLMVFIPYPIKLLRYKYLTNEYVYLGKIKIEEITEDLGDMFERLWAIENVKEIEEKRILKEYQDNLDRINKVFNENFEE
jgi:hypothetical protein